MDHFYGFRNVCNRSNTLELLFLAPKNTFELLLSSEIGQFDVEELDFLGILPFSFVPTVEISIKVNGKSLKIDLLDFKLIYLGAHEEFESVLGR